MLLALAVAAAGAAAQPLPGAIAARCPRLKPQPLPTGALASAVREAEREAPQIYGRLRLGGMRATRAALAPLDPDRGGFARHCGGSLEARSIVVYLEFPQMLPSSSLSQGVLLLARFGGRMRVWAVLH